MATYNSKFALTRRSGILVGLAALATIGITLLQVYLLKQVFQSHDHYFYQKARTVLYRIAEKMEVYENIKYKKQMDSLASMQGLLISDSEGTLIYRKELSNTNSQFTYTEKFLTKRFKVPTHLLNADISKDSSINIDVLEKTYLGDLKFKGVKEDKDMPIQSLIDLNSLESKIPQTYLDIEKAVLPFSQRLSKQELERIIFKETKGLGIDQKDIEYCIYKDGLPTFVRSERYIKNDREIKLEVLPNRRSSSTLGVRYELGIQFKNVYTHIRDLMTPITTLSIILALITIGSLAYTVFYVYMEGRIWKFKKGFIDNITHEFKTPVASINLALDLLTDGFKKDSMTSIEKKTRAENYIKIIKSSAQKISNQIDTVLTLSSLNRKNPTLNYTYVDLSLLVEQEVKNWKVMIGNNKAKEGSIHLALDNSLEQSPKCKVDDTHFRSVINNLIDNAYKYSIKTVYISVSVWYDGKFFYIAISDRGIGIPYRDISKIFGNFYRSENKKSTGIPGHGLGLSYVQKILDLHRAKISVVTQENKGSTFTIKIKPQ